MIWPRIYSQVKRFEIGKKCFERDVEIVQAIDGSSPTASCNAFDVLKADAFYRTRPFGPCLGRKEWQRLHVLSEVEDCVRVDVVGYFSVEASIQQHERLGMVG